MASHRRAKEAAPPGGAQGKIKWFRFIIIIIYIMVHMVNMLYGLLTNNG